jgi:hypothetical protein
MASLLIRQFANNLEHFASGKQARDVSLGGYLLQNVEDLSG